MTAGCDRVIEIEDLVLGLVGGADATELEGHLASCDDCQGARETFLAERELFQARPWPPAPAIAPPKPALVHRLAGHRVVPALAALAACVAIFVGRPHRGADCDEPVAATLAAAPAEEPPSATAICRAPSGPPLARATTLASHEESACVPSANATCDVTFETAMP